MTEPTRKCLACGEPTAELVGATQHDLRVRTLGVPVGTVDHGRSLEYTCSGCGASYTLLDRRRRGWFVYGVAVGLASIAFGALVIGVRDGTIFFVIGAVAGLASLGFLGYDAAIRLRTAL